MAKRLTSLRITKYEIEQIDQLRQKLDVNQSELLMLAVDRMYRQEFPERKNPMNYNKETQPMNTNLQPNRQQFAETVAHAYFHQLGHVMGLPRVDYDPDTGKFSSGSNVNPTQYSDIEIMTIEEGGFGDIDVNEEGGEQALVEWIADDNDELWREVLATIEEETEAAE